MISNERLYTKYKTIKKKYLDTKIGGSHQPNIYEPDVDTFYLFSDWEGNIMTRDEIIDRKCSEINEFFSTIPFDGNLNSNYGFAFLGDLIDNGPSSIKLMQQMIYHKLHNPNKVILIAGNRDLNKVRLSDEYEIVHIRDDTPVICKKSCDYMYHQSFDELVDTINDNSHLYKFKMSMEEIVERFNKNVAPNTLTIPVDDDDSKFLNRVNFLYRNTLGAPLEVENNYQEKLSIHESYLMNGWVRLNEIGKNYDGNNKKRAIALCLLNTFMANECHHNMFKNDNINQLNGLYLKYMNCCNIVAKLVFDNKNYLLSHRGFPMSSLIKEDGQYDFILLYSDNYIDEKDKETILATGNSTISLDMIMNSYNSLLLNPIYNLEKLMRLSGALPNDTLFSPVVSRNSKKGMNLRGGYISFYEFTKRDDIYAVIYGHDPVGFVPNIESNMDINDTKWIGIDVSKASSMFADSYSFSVYKLKKGERDLIFGRFNITNKSGLTQDSIFEGERHNERKFVYHNFVDDIILNKFISSEDPTLIYKGIVEDLYKKYKLFYKPNGFSKVLRLEEY